MPHDDDDECRIVKNTDRNFDTRILSRPRFPSLECNKISAFAYELLRHSCPPHFSSFGAKCVFIVRNS